MAPHSSTLAWKIPGMEEPGRLQSMGSIGVGHDWATSLSLFTFMHWRRKWQPTPVFLPGESQGWGAWWAAVYGVTQSRTRLKWLSSSSSSSSLPSTLFLLLKWKCGYWEEQGLFRTSTRVFNLKCLWQIVRFLKPSRLFLVQWQYAAEEVKRLIADESHFKYLLTNCI